VRILHVVPTYLPATRYGGPIYAVHGLAKALAARGHEVDVFTTNVDGPGVSDVALDQPIMLDGVRIRYFAASFPRLYVSPAMRRAFRASLSRYDVAHLHSVYLWPTAAAARAAAVHGVPYVISPRGMLVRELIARKSLLVKSLWLRMIERRNFARAAAIHFTSEREQEDARVIGLPLPSPFIVPNGIDLPPVSSDTREAATILFLGRVTWKKGLDRLVSALPMIEGARLEVAGNDEEGYIPRLRELAVALGVGERVAFHGHVEGEVKRALLARATLFALPSLSENFGNAVLEAMAASTPVVVTPEVGLAAEVARSGAGIVAQGDPRLLADAISQLLRDPARCAEMGAGGRKAVKDRYTWSRVAEEMESRYAQLRR
jgi:glycosyltransferase involved in cell wall biosynthesis